VQKIET